MTFIYNNIHSLKFTKKPILNIYNKNNFFKSISVGIPINVFSNIYTNIHYGYDITDFKTFFIQFLLSYYTYGKDRYSDALEYNNLLKYNVSLINYDNNKKILYNEIIQNQNFYLLSFIFSFSVILYILLNDFNNIYNLPFIQLLYTTNYYKDIKKYISIFKPFYISIMWTMASVILPCVLHDDNYNILFYPQDYLPFLLTIFATSNFADNKDIIEDKFNNINTIPVVFGKYISNYINILCLSLGSIILINSIHFENRFLVNSLVEIQNLGLITLIYNDTFN